MLLSNYSFRTLSIRLLPRLAPEASCNEVLTYYFEDSVINLGSGMGPYFYNSITCSISVTNLYKRKKGKSGYDSSSAEGKIAEPSIIT